MNKPTVSFSLRNRFSLPHDFNVYVNLNHNFSSYFGVGLVKPNTNLSLQLIKQFCHKTWTVNLYVNDLLKTSFSNTYTYGNHINLCKSGYEFARRLSLTVTYNFNASQSKYKGKGAGAGEKGRM